MKQHITDGMEKGAHVVAWIGIFVLGSLGLALIAFFLWLANFFWAGVQ